MRKKRNLPASRKHPMNPACNSANSGTPGENIRTVAGATDYLMAYQAVELRRKRVKKKNVYIGGHIVFIEEVRPAWETRALFPAWR
jgi:hypothetical protein